MIWYLLYPVRGTSKPPRLSPDHPLRRAFYRHGILTAQHWLPAMLFSCAVAAALAYPTVFLSGNPTAGFTSKPHQIWAAARALDDAAGIDVDIEMRQIWVHGSHMKALDKDVLQSALRIQQSIIGNADLEAVPSNRGSASEPVSWGFHSPLMYWNNSAEAIDRDVDVVKTINDRARSSSSLEVSLRPASVFAGKMFSRSKLSAADALVMTLMNRAEDNVGLRWQQKMHTLEYGACPDCKLYPPHGEVSRSWLYEFTFTPVTFQENVFLAFAYGCMALYVLLSLQRLKAFHSRFGLVVTAITQMIMSILASFTICGLLKINLVAVPQNAYPFILLVIGIENMFRLINAILAYPATMATDLRIANALGDVGPLSIATAAQNLIVLWLLSLVVSPGIVAFCSFAAIATLVDTFFLLTFFVAVLNVDIRRLELQDSLSRSKEAAQRQKSPTPQTSWFDALLQGKLPLSTRMAGSVVTTTFILTLNLHFFERSARTISLRHLLGLNEPSTSGPIDFDTFAPPPMNATLTPGEWVRMQDFDTAREVMRLVNTGAQRFVIRVFTPLVIVLSGADRSGTIRDAQAWSEEWKDFTVHHIYPFVVAVIFIVTFVAVLMNFLLWNDAPEVSEEIEEKPEDEAIQVRHIHTCHKLDVVRMHGSGKGHVVTVGFDRSVNIIEPDREHGGYISTTLPTELASLLRFRPILQAAIDETGQYLAFRTSEDSIIVCDRKTKDVVKQISLEDAGPTILFQFVQLAGRQNAQPGFVFLSATGQLSVVDLMAKSSRLLSPVAGVLSANLISEASGVSIVLAVEGDSKTVELRTFTLTNTSCSLARSLSLPAAFHPRHDSKISIEHFRTESELYLVARIDNAVHVVSEDLSKVIKTVASPEQEADVVSTMMCQHSSVPMLGILSEDQNSESLSLRTANYLDTPLWTDTDDAVIISGTDASQVWTIAKPGFWLILPTQVLLGVRKKQSISIPQPKMSSLRSRNKQLSQKAVLDEEPTWESYAMSVDGDLGSVEFQSSPNQSDDEMPLFVTKAGPGVVFDDNSMAVALGNVVKILSISKSRLQPRQPGKDGLERHGSTNRKRGGPRKML